MTRVPYKQNARFSPPSLAEPLGEAGVRYLTLPQTQEWLRTLEPLAKDPLRMASRLAGCVSDQERRWIMDYLKLLPRLREKFGLSVNLVGDQLAYEQSTGQDLGQWKAALWPSGASLPDLCCGRGGDSFFVAPTVQVQAYDMDPARVAMYQYNLGLLERPFQAHLGDVRSLSSGADFFCMDPARREQLGQNQRDWTLMTPTVEEIQKVAQRYGGGVLKLAPGFPLEALPAHLEYWYLGGRNDCRELLVMMGSLITQPGRVRAVSLDSSVRQWEGSLDSTLQRLPVAGLGRFLFEPQPVLVRSHLFVNEAQRLGLWQIDEGLAYLSGDSLLEPDSGLVAYPILGHCPLSTGAVRQLLRQHDMGNITLKKRGVEIVPEAEIKRLAPKGSQRGILFYTRLQGQKTAILTQEPLRG